MEELDLDTLSEAIEKHVNSREPLEPSIFMDGHLDRLSDLIDAWGRRGIEVRRVGEYIVVSSARALRKASKIIKDSLYDLIDDILENQSLETIEESMPALRTPPLIDSDLYRFEQSSGAVVVGIDRESGKVFVHPLPWFMVGLLGLASESVDEGLLRVLMGFDHNPWEDGVEEGKIVRIQGDMAVRIVKYFESQEEARRWAAAALLRYGLAWEIYKAGLWAVEEASRILQEARPDPRSTNDIAYTAMMAVAKGIVRAYGSLVEDRGLGIDLDIEVTTPDRSVRRLREPQVVTIRIYMDSHLYPHEILSQCVSREGRVCTGVEDLRVALHRILNIASSINSTSDLSNFYLYTGGRVINVRLLNQVMTSIAAKLEEKVQDLVEDLLSGRTPDTRGWGVLGERVLELFKRIQRAIEVAEIEVEVDDHKISTTGILLQDELVARALTLSYMAETANLLIISSDRADTVSKLFNMYRRRKRARKDIIVAIARFLSIKTGTRYMIVLGDQVIEASHPEHGEASIGLPRPALVELTSLNTNVQTDDIDLEDDFWEEFEDEEDEDRLPPYNEGIEP